MPFVSPLMRIFAIVESVKRATYGGVLAPGIRRAVIRICGKFGILATKALNLSGDFASVIGRNEIIDALCKPFRPVVFDQGCRIGEMGALDVRKFEFTNVLEDPFVGEL